MTWIVAAGSNSLVIGIAVGVVMGLLLRKRFSSFVKREGRPHALLVAGLIAATGLLYSVVHEYGHKLVAVMLGGEVTSVSWTAFSGRPHVVYGYMPEGSRPWAAAGGIVVPVLLAYLLVGARWTLGRWLPRWAKTLLAVPAGTILLISCGAVVPIFTGRGHMASLAAHYGWGETGRVGLQLGMAGVSLLGLAALYFGARRRRVR
ncbi:MAG: hypothetical protein OER88_03265 [Planctomycetota bacterium]|nr:hypothetical protein [Planctomycetota bacterium]